MSVKNNLLTSNGRLLIIFIKGVFIKILFFISSAVLFFMFISESAAQWNDKSDGCGLGWKVTSEKTFSATTTRAVTNVFIPPTFGMSSGTLGCETHGLVQKQGQIKYYVNATFDHLLNDFSNGEGEYLKNYLSFYDCKKAKNNPERTRTFFKNYLTNNSISIDSFINSSHHWIQRSVCAP